LKRMLRNNPMPMNMGARARNQMYDESKNELTKEVREIHSVISLRRSKLFSIRSTAMEVA